MGSTDDSLSTRRHNGLSCKENQWHISFPRPRQTRSRQLRYCRNGSYRTVSDRQLSERENEYTIPYIEYFINPPAENVWYSTYQSEEGGRFFHEQNLNIIVEVGDEFPIEVDPNYCWMTLNQLMSFVTYNNYLNIAARSLLSSIKFN